MKDPEKEYTRAMAKKLILIDELGGRCRNCGEDNPIVLDFHHIGGKNFSISRMSNSRLSVIREESKKCELLCSNCHSLEHFKNSRNGREMTKLRLDKDFTECQRCGIKPDNLCCLDFHHTNPSTKKFEISDAILRKMAVSVFDLNEELNKCEALCKNCHRKEHHQEKFDRLKIEILNHKILYREIQPKIDRDMVKHLIKSGLKQIEIARRFKASKGTISSIVKELYPKDSSI
jgi:5-methylcytosine-specific restriction endonuclease McrA